MSQTPRPIRVLIADDEEEILELLGEYLRTRGYQVWTASDGEDALDVMRTAQIDVLLTDNRMPAVGGVELLIEAQRLAQPVAAIVMTGFGTVEAAIRAMKAGASDFILKPFKLREVHSSLVKAYDRLAMDREAARTRELLQFYELAHGLDSAEGMPRLAGTMASVALRETGATEVAVWLDHDGDWQAIARAGSMAGLTDTDPDTITAPMALPGDGVAAPVLDGTRRVGAVAVAGIKVEPDAAMARLGMFCRVFGESIVRVGLTRRD